MSHTRGPWVVETNDTYTNVEGKFFTVASDVSNDDADIIASSLEMVEAISLLLKNSRIGKSSSNKTSVLCKLDDIQRLENILIKLKLV